MLWVAARANGANEYIRFRTVMAFWTDLEGATKFTSKAEALEELARRGGMPTARVVGIDPHGFTR